jgi:cell division control protein 6
VVEARSRSVGAMSTVFRDRERLLPNFPIEQYWTSLPHREKQLTLLRNFYRDILDKGGDTYLRVCQVIGPAGTGKTCTARLFGDNLSKEARKKGISLDHVYLNLKLEGGRKVVLYRNLLGKIDPSLVSASLSAEELLRGLVTYLQDKKRRVLLTLDELDYYVKHFREEAVVYDLTRLNEITPKPCGVVGVTFLARDRQFHDILEKAELSTLGRTYIDFEPYTSSDVLDILERRVKEALLAGSYSQEILGFIADVTAQPPIYGDMRYALDLLLYSGNLADSEASSVITPEHVRIVRGETHHGITTEDIVSLPEEERLVLKAVVRALRRRKQPYTSLREIRGMLAVVAEESSHKPVEDVEECVQDLSDRGVVDVKSLTQIGISGVPVESLDGFLGNLAERIERSGTTNGAQVKDGQNGS